MFKIFETENYKENIIKLWQDVFGDSRDEVLYFINNCSHKNCLCLEYDGVLASMLFLVDCRVGEKEYKYIYAACTSQSYRNRGFMTDLLQYCLRSYYNVLLIPANAGLISFYRKVGFDLKIELSDIHFDENEKICGYLFDGCSLKEPFALSNNNKSDNT